MLHNHQYNQLRNHQIHHQLPQQQLHLVHLNQNLRFHLDQIRSHNLQLHPQQMRLLQLDQKQSYMHGYVIEIVIMLSV